MSMIKKKRNRKGAPKNKKPAEALRDRHSSPTASATSSNASDEDATYEKPYQLHRQLVTETHSIMTALLHNVYRNPTNPIILSGVCQALWNALMNDRGGTVATYVTAGGGLRLLLDAMHKNLECMVVQETACGALGCLLKGDGTTRASFVKEKGISVILQAMRADPDNELMQYAGCIAFANASNDDDVVSHIVADPNSIPTILNAMRRHEGSADVQYGACSTLYNLSSGRKSGASGDEYHNKVQIIVAGGILALTNALGQHPHDGDIQAGACAAVANLAYSSAAEKNPLIFLMANTEGLVENIVQALMTHGQISTRVLDESVRALRNLSSTEKVPAQVKRAGAMPLLQSIAVTYGDKRCGRNAALIISQC